MPGTKIRRAVRADLPELLRLIAQLAAPGAPTADQTRIDETWARIAETPWYQVWIAEAGGRVVGTYSLLVIPLLAHGCAPAALVEDVVVDEAMRGIGVGAAMMRHAMERAREAGAYKLALSSNRRRIEAHVFYRRLGFKDHGVSLLVEPAA
jgi:GNAT superfamily N-acetyltransferase